MVKEENMSAIIFIKASISIFFFSQLIFYTTKYIYLAFQIIPEEKIRSNFINSWKSSFFMLAYLFSLVLLWCPTIIQKDFFSNPLPTLIAAVIASLILATLLANSALQPSRSIVISQKILDFLEKKRKNN